MPAACLVVTAVNQVNCQLACLTDMNSLRSGFRKRVSDVEFVLRGFTDVGRAVSIRNNESFWYSISFA